MPVCPACAQANPDIARFCLSCGTPLAASPPVRRERRVVTVLFADLVGFTARSERLDVEEVEGVLSPYHALLRGELERFGGTVEKFIGDAVMALFGAPLAHEDDPERAVRAALSIRDRIAELDEGEGLDLHVRIGVNTGEALVALGADPAQGRGLASGDVINTAARLQTAAPVDGVLVGESTYWATRREIDYAAFADVDARGKAAPVPAWRALEPRSRLGVDLAREARSALVGRDHELEALTRALARVRRDRAPQLMTLVGVPGIGKSRLVYELGQVVEADAELISWRQGRSLPYGEGVTFWALGEMVKAQAGILESDSAEVAEERLRRSVADAMVDTGEAAWVTAHLRALIGVASGTDLHGHRREEAFAGWRRFFEALAEQGPLVLVFEDLHWADDALLDFVDHLVEWAVGVPLLVVATARPELLARRPGWGGGKRNAAIVSLEPLGPADTARLIGALLRQAALPAELQEALLAHAGGNPLYAEEYVLMLQDRGFLRHEGGAWRLERAGELPLPESVQGLIAARLDALAPAEKGLLQDGSVLGKVFWPGALAAIAEGDAPQLAQQLHELERREFLRRERRSSVAAERQYAFSHLLVRDVVYGQIPRAGRAAKHRRAAAWLESLAPDRADDRAEMLAYHYLQALEYAPPAERADPALRDPARRALREAGDRAASLGAVASAEQLYRSALGLCDPEDPDRPRLLLGLGTALQLGGNRGADELREARDADADPDVRAQASLRLAELSWFHGQRDEGFAHLDDALGRIDEQPSVTRARAVSLLSRWRIVAGQPQAAIAAARELLAMADELELPEMRAAALNNLGSARFRSGDPGGLEDLEASAEAARGISIEESLRATNNLATMLIELGELARGASLIREGEQLSARLGHAPIRRLLRGDLAQSLYWAGSMEGALELVEREVAEADAGSPHYATSFCRLLRGRIRQARGDLAGALVDSERALALARVAKDPQVLDDATAIHALMLVAAGDRDGAGRLADELLEAWEADGVRYPPAALTFAWLALDVDRARQLDGVLSRQPYASRWVDAARLILAGDAATAAALLRDMGDPTDADETLARAAPERRRVSPA